MSAALRIIESCHRWLDPGDLGDKLRGDEYRQLIGCGFHPALDTAGDIGTVRTSCAIFARAILHDSGVLPALRPGHAGWPMWGGWLGVLSPRHRAWVRADAGVMPVPAVLFYVESPTNPNNNHVGFLLSETAPGRWLSAEGGQGDGTRCRFSQRLMGPAFAGNRVLRGWFDPDLIASAETADTERPPPPTVPRTLRRGMHGDDVRAIQRRLGITADGDYGPITTRAVQEYQTAHGLTDDGVVGPMTRKAMGL